MKTQITVVRCPPGQRPCRLNWESLTPTDEANVRTCPHCGEAVFLCKTDAEAIAHAAQGHCLAMPIFHDSEDPENYLDDLSGELTPAEEAALKVRRIEGAKERALKNAQHANRNCAVCGFPMPPWVKACGVCEMMTFDPNKWMRLIAEQSPGAYSSKAADGLTGNAQE
jgi:hypothetical protein